MTGGLGGQDGWGREVRHRAAFFYADYGLVASTYPVFMKGGFYTLYVLFDRGVIRSNVGKTVRMICRPCQTPGTQSETAYERRITGEGITYREIQIIRFQCSEFGEEILVGSLMVHWQTQHRVDSGGRRQWETPPPDGEPQMYQMDFPTVVGPWEFPVKGCRGWLAIITSMIVHFLHRHVRDTVIILE